MEARFFQAFEQEQLTQVEHWLRMLPEEQILGSPYLLLARAWSSQARGHLKDLPGLLKAAEQLLASGDWNTNDVQDPSLRLLRGLAATLWSLFNFFSGQIQASLESARSALTVKAGGIASRLRTGRPEKRTPKNENQLVVGESFAGEGILITERR